MVLKAYWPLDETSGSTAKDVRGGNDGTLNGGVTQGAQGILGTTAYGFDGADDYVDTGTPLAISGKFTACAWVYPTEVNSQIHTFISNLNDYDDADAGGFSLSIDPDEVWEFAARDGATETVTANGQTTVSAGEWYFICGIWDGSNLRIYENGVEIATTPLASRNQTNGNDNFNIGRSQDYGQPWDGRIADVRIYDHALTKQEVQYLYQVGRRGLHTSDKRSL